MLNILIQRHKSSYAFKANPKLPDSFDNNWHNNSKDRLILRDDKAEVFSCRCQTVANYCFGDQKPGDTVSFGDTVAPGLFKVRLFVEPRNFHGEIHAICSTTDIDGQWINHEAMQTTKDGFQNGRWLIHDRYSKKLGTDSNYAWSAGCFILSSEDLESLNNMLKLCNAKPGTVISGRLEEIDK